MYLLNRSEPFPFSIISTITFHITRFHNEQHDLAY